jgi:Mg2+ and Co2+ transporter CorA
MYIYLFVYLFTDRVKTSRLIADIQHLYFSIITSFSHDFQILETNILILEKNNQIRNIYNSEYIVSYTFHLLISL